MTVGLDYLPEIGLASQRYGTRRKRLQKGKESRFTIEYRQKFSAYKKINKFMSEMSFQCLLRFGAHGIVGMSAISSCRDTADRLSPDISSEEVVFLDHSETCCICIVDMVNSTKIIAKISDNEKIRKYYSIFINTMVFLAKNYGAKIIKNLGDGIMYYFPRTADATDKDSFKDVIDA